jgi:YVTN family beta-propeller protein
VNTEERQLSNMLRRVTPEPPSRVTVEDVAFRLANQAAGSRRHREPRGRPGSPGHGSPGRGSWGRGWAPALAAAASVIVVAGASAGIATVVTSHRGPVSSAGGASPSASVSTSASSPAPSQLPTSEGPSSPPERVANGMWGAELITRDTFNQDSLTSGPESLYATAPGYLVRINPANGEIVNSAPYIPSIANLPIITGNTVWVVASYAGRSVVLHGYDGKTLAQVASVIVPVAGQVSTAASGVLTTGSGGYLYVAAGRSVAVVNPSTHQVIKQISVSAGPVSSVAVAPDGSKLYVSTSTFDLLIYNLATGAKLGSSAIPGLTSTAGNLVATSGGVWGTTGVGMTESAWFAPDADLTRMVRLSTGAGAGLSSVPVISGGTVWIGGSHTLVCANPATGQVLKSVTIPTDGSVVEYVGSVTITGGRAYAYYLNYRSQQAGVVALTPPGACSG